MPNTTAVHLITGFLGSGKTTFLNRIITDIPKHLKLTIMINEFGEIGVDGTLIKGEALDIMEISKGSIFCACVKTDFIKGLYALYQITQPDLLLIEPTGVANPKDLKRDLMLPIFNNRFDYREQFCMIDCAHFLEAHQMYASLEKQIASSTVFILNKTDLATRERIEKTKGIIRQIHPSPIFFETTYAQIPHHVFFQPQDGVGLLSAAEALQTDSTQQLSDDQLDSYINTILDNPDFEITPPDCLMSMTLRWKGARMEQLQALAQSLPAAIVRAKGLVTVDSRLHLFSHVMGDWTVTPADLSTNQIKGENVVVVIGPPDAVSHLSQQIDSRVWDNMGLFQPQV